MKKLHVVKVEHTVYVMAEDEFEAEVVALQGIADVDDTPCVYSREVTYTEPVGSYWRNSVPFGSDNQRTVARILEGIAPKS